MSPSVRAAYGIFLLTLVRPQRLGRVKPAVVTASTLAAKPPHCAVPNYYGPHRSAVSPGEATPRNQIVRSSASSNMGGINGAVAANGREPARNVLGTELQCCCTAPVTGFFRDGYCHTGPSDFGRHVVCAVVTEQFLTFTASRGNDLSTPNPAFNFPGLKPGDRWCLCASRWREAMEAGCAPKVVLAATHEKALQAVTLEQLESHAVEEEEDEDQAS